MAVPVDCRQVLQIENYESTDLNRKSTKSTHAFNASFNQIRKLQPHQPLFISHICLIHFASISEGRTACEPRNSTVPMASYYLMHFSLGCLPHCVHFLSSALLPTMSSKSFFYFPYSSNYLRNRRSAAGRLVHTFANQLIIPHWTIQFGHNRWASELRRSSG